MPAPIHTQIEDQEVFNGYLLLENGIVLRPLLDEILEEFSTKRVRLSTSQHLGAPAVPTVSVGDTVRKGDVIATAKEGALSVNLHASIDGTVQAVTKDAITIYA